MSQCLNCVCKSCDRYLLCRGLINVCGKCFVNEKNPCSECKLEESIARVFSPLSAIVNVNGIDDAIANHLYKTISHNNSGIDSFLIDGITCDEKHYYQYQKMLWIKYFRANPVIVTFAKELEHHLADLNVGDYQYQIGIALRYLKDGERSLLSECKELIILMKSAQKAS